MQINDAKLLGTGQAEASQAEKVQGGAAGRQSGATKPQAATDAVELSSFANNINGLQEGSPGRDTRVNELRELYNQGRYEVDPAALAQSIVSEHIRL